MTGMNFYTTHMDHFSFTADFSSSPCHIISDCFGSVYEIVQMTGNGFCGFNSLSFCLTGSENYFEDIIDDCFNVFVNLPQLQLFRTRGMVLDQVLTEI